MPCHSFMVLNRAIIDMSAADLKHTQNYRNFSGAEIRFFSLVEIPMKHSSLYTKICHQTSS